MINTYLEQENKHYSVENRSMVRRRVVKMKSFVQYDAGTDFPIENLPYGVFTSAHNVSASLFMFFWVAFLLSIFRGI